MNSVNSNSNQPPPVVGYLSGPVDARKVYRAWRDEAHTELFGTSYLRHWFNEVEDQGRSGVVITSEAGEAYEETHGNFTILNRPKPTSSGLRYHMDMVRWTRERLTELEGAGARTVVMTDAPQYWFVTPPFRRRWRRGGWGARRWRCSGSRPRPASRAPGPGSTPPATSSRRIRGRKGSRNLQAASFT